MLGLVRFFFFPTVLALALGLAVTQFAIPICIVPDFGMQRLHGHEMNAMVPLRYNDPPVLVSFDSLRHMAQEDDGSSAMNLTRTDVLPALFGTRYGGRSAVYLQHLPCTLLSTILHELSVKFCN